MLICRVKYPRTRRRCKGWSYSRFLSRSPGDPPLPRHEILTLLHKTTSLLPRALPPKVQTRIPTESVEFWKDILSETYNDLLSKESRPAKITVYGVDEWAGSQDLVTALLEEPLTSDELHNEEIRTRWDKHAGQASLAISSSANPGNSTFHTSSSFLRQFSVPLQIIELCPRPRPTSPSAAHASSVIAERTPDVLLRADVAIVVCNPVTTPVPAILQNPVLSRNSNTILVITSTPPARIADSLRTMLSQSVADGTLRSTRILFVDPSRALAANEVIKSDSRSTTSVQRYQDDFVGSRVSTVTAALRELIASSSEPSQTLLRARTSLARSRAALLTCQASLKHERTEMDSVSGAVSTLKGRIEEAKARAQREVLARTSTQNTPKSSDEGDAVAEAVQQAGKEVKAVMDRLTWWRMVWRVDEISLLVTQAVHNAWCRDLERQLILQTGRLAALQQEMTKIIFDLLAAHPHPPYNSAVLHNSLRQLAASPSFPVTPNTLTHPIYARRAQIIEHPTTSLHLTGQRAVLGMGGGIAAGAEQMGWMQTRCTVPCAPPPNSDVLVAIASNTNLDSSIQMRNPITSATPDSEVRCESHPNNLEAQYDVGDTRRFHPKVEAADSTATSAPPPNRDVLVASLNTQNPSSPSSTSSTEKNTGRVMENVEGDECGNGNEIAAGGPGRRINTAVKSLQGCGVMPITTTHPCVFASSRERRRRANATGSDPDTSGGESNATVVTKWRRGPQHSDGVVEQMGWMQTRCTVPAGWYGWLGATGEGLLGNVGLDPGTAVGVGLLTAALSVRWAVGKWERSKRRWWQDWNRVGEGLGRDLRRTVDEAMREKVLVVPDTGCDKLSELVAHRRQEIEQIEEELNTLRTDLGSQETQHK
ncbi:hypothetical protein LshimejAT787_0407100 [Lyophyllum shimeji]|uniref:Uncharacterized protein n=1 Tax=Lyophyllum shimeji TaxID=47721 RepID=A0A9P3UK46_LYOSH|nr:hypothetical protein LshimejAT787_0407100 [Lyophyllum shimeji]